MDTKALRQKILDLAIRGKLVPQDPNDEPASVLLERIRAEKQQMVKDGRLKAKDVKNDTVIFVGEDNLHYEKFADGSVKCIEDEIPFEIPDGWSLLRLQSFVTFIGGSQPPKSTFEYVSTPDNIRLIQIRDYKTDKYATYIPRSSARRFCTKNDVMIGRYGPPIFQILRGIEGSYNVALMKAVADPRLMENNYLFYLLQDGELLKMLESLSDRTCGQDGINMYELNRYIVGIPPIPEQHRIIEYLEKALPIADTIANDRDSLIATIQKAKAKVLDLAIRGKLVPQNSHDEPASVLLDRICAEKEELIKQGKIKRVKRESVIFRGEDNSYYETIDGNTENIDDEIALDVPEHWALARLKSIYEVNPKNKVADKMLVSFVPMTLIEDQFSGRFSYEVKLWKECKTGFTHFAEGDVGFAKISPCFENRKSAIFSDLSNGYGAGTTELFILRSHGRAILPEFTLYFVKSGYFISRGKGTFSGVVGQQRIDKSVVLDTIVPIPPLKEQKRIADRIKRLFSILDTVLSSIE